MFELSEEELQKLGGLFVDYLKQRIKDKIYPYGNPKVRGTSNKIASGNLYNSIKSEVKQTEDGLMLELQYLDYFEYVNLGRRKGRGYVPIKALLNWIKIRGIKGRNKKGRFIKNLSLAFAIQKNIHKFGIRRTNLYDKAYDSLEDVLINPPNQFRDEYERLYQAIAEDVENFLDKTITKALSSI